MIGFHFIQTPSVIVRDPELVKSVLQTNFPSFRNNGLTLSEKTDPVLTKNPFLATDPHIWKVTRARSGNHLSGKKLGYLFIFVQDVCSKMDAYIDRKIKQSKDGFHECELKDLFVKCTGEIVANAAFAIQGQSFEDNPDRLSFATVAKTIFEPNLFNGIKQALIFYLPDLAQFLGIAFLQKKTDAYFRENLKLILKQRKQTNSTPNDFLQFVIESNPEDDIDSIIADVIIFYGDVYETSSTVMSLLFFHLSQNIKIQNKLREHILTVLKTTNGVVTYDSLKNMNYLDQVVMETMRLTAPAGVLQKLCTEEITLKGSDGLTCHLEPGHRVFISIFGLHNDSKYWPDSGVFDPERFTPENQADRNKFVFIPFGEGPRMCIGMRLGLMLVKLATVSLITKYSIEHSQKTRLPLEMDPTSILTYYKGGLWAKFKKLN